MKLPPLAQAHPEDQDLARIAALASHLRAYPLLPPSAQEGGTDFTDVDSGVRLPTCHCAFRGCQATTSESFEEEHWGMEKWLFDHLMQVHRCAVCAAHLKPKKHAQPELGFYFFPRQFVLRPFGSIFGSIAWDAPNSG